MRPESGSIGAKTPNTNTSSERPDEIRHRQKQAIDRIHQRRRGACPRSARRTPPRRRPSTIAKTSEAIASSNVAGSRSASNSSTWRCKEIEVPKSPCAGPAPRREIVSRAPHRGRNGRAAPRYRAAEAPGEIIIAIGSPGTTRNSTNTMTATPEQGDRRHAEPLQQAQSHSAGRDPRARSAAPASRPALLVESGLRHQRRLQRAGAVGGHLQRRLVDDRLRHIAAAGSPSACRRYICRPPSSRRCAWPRPSRPTAARSARRDPCDFQAECGEGLNIANPVEWSGRRSHCPSCRTPPAPACAPARSSIVLGDLVDLDLGLDADLAPHADDRLDHLVILRLEAARRLDRELDRLFRGIAAGRRAASLAFFGIVRRP